MQTNAWLKEWNSILREVFYKDTELKQLMLVPEGCKIIPFFDKYFIRAGYTDELLVDEKVRVVYSLITIDDTADPNVKKNAINFDIYVRSDQSHNATEDRQQSRAELIAQRQSQLQRKNRYVRKTGYRFWPKTEGDMGTRTVGYGRYHISFYYMRVYP